MVSSLVNYSSALPSVTLMFRQTIKLTVINVISWFIRQFFFLIYQSSPKSLMPKCRSIAYCNKSVNVISLLLSKSVHIKQLPLQNTFYYTFFPFRGAHYLGKALILSQSLFRFTLFAQLQPDFFLLPVKLPQTNQQITFISPG